MIMLMKNYLSKKTLLYIRNNIFASYHNNVIDHYENPRNVGKLNKKDINVGTGLVGAPACGDVMQLQIKVNNDGIIEKAVFKTFGCGSAIASASFTTELLHGMHIDKATSIKNTDIANHLKLPPVKLHCSMLAEESIKGAVENYKQKKNNFSFHSKCSFINSSYLVTPENMS